MANAIWRQPIDKSTYFSLPEVLRPARRIPTSNNPTPRPNTNPQPTPRLLPKRRRSSAAGSISSGNFSLEFIMTCIIFKDGIIASDSQISSGNRILGEGKKIYDLGDKILAYCGSTTGGENFRNFLEGKECNPKIIDDKDYDFEAIVITKDTKEILYYDKYCVSDKIEAPFHRLGSGSDYARGALAAGASIEEAINIAARYDKGTGGNIKLLKIW